MPLAAFLNTPLFSGGLGASAANEIAKFLQYSTVPKWSRTNGAEFDS